MKYLSIFIIGLIISSCSPTLSPIDFSLEVESYTGIGVTMSSKRIPITILNNSKRDITIHWERVESKSMNGWTYTMNNSQALEGLLTIPENKTITIYLNIESDQVEGDVEGEIIFFDSENKPLTLKTFKYSFVTSSSLFSINPVGLMSRTVRNFVSNTDYHIWVRNDNELPVEVHWEKMDQVANPAAWEIAVCTDLLCFTPNIIHETMIIEPHDSVDFKATISHYGILGTGGTNILFYDKSDSLATLLTQVISETVIQ